MSGIKHDEDKFDYRLVDFSVVYGEDWGRTLNLQNGGLMHCRTDIRWAQEFCVRMNMLAENPLAEGYDEDSKHIWAIKQFVAVMNEGAKKYSANNWQEVRPVSRYYSALIRHDIAAGISEDDNAINPDFGLPHLAHSMWNCYALAWFERAGVKW